MTIFPSKYYFVVSCSRGFLGGSEGKESACKAGDLGSIPGLGRCPGEGNSDPLEYFCWRIPWTEEPDEPYIVYGFAKNWTQLSD